jgi:hypothetical protein
VDSDQGFSLDASDTGYKLFGRYMFNNGFGIEGGYIDFGKPDDDFLGQTAQIDAEAWSLYGVGALGLSDNFDLFAKAGFISWEADSLLNGVPVGFDDGEDLALGIGAKLVRVVRCRRGRCRLDGFSGPRISLLTGL